MLTQSDRMECTFTPAIISPPDFKKLQADFQGQLDRRKGEFVKTTPKEFKFGQSKKLPKREYLNKSNAQSWGPSKNKKKVRKLGKVPQTIPSTTKATR